MRTVLTIILTSLSVLCPLAAPGSEKASFVRIVSPKSGIVVRPGEHVTITVDATPNTFAEVMSLPFAAWSLSGPPYEIAISLPSKIDSGPLEVAAIGVPPSGLKGIEEKDIVQDKIELDVERPDSPVSISGQLSTFPPERRKVSAISETNACFR